MPTSSHEASETPSIKLEIQEGMIGISPQLRPSAGGIGLKEFHSQKENVGLGLIPNIRLSIFEENTRLVVYIQDISWLPVRISFCPWKLSRWVL